LKWARALTWNHPVSPTRNVIMIYDEKTAIEALLLPLLSSDVSSLLLPTFLRGVCSSSSSSSEMELLQNKRSDN